MINIEQVFSILDALPDPAFIISKEGKYVAVFGGRDTRYYHDGSMLVGMTIFDVLKQEKSNWFFKKIAEALTSKKLLIEEYELSNKDVKGLPDEGPEQPIWFEGRIQALDFLVEGEPVVLWVASNITARHELEFKLREQSYTDQLTGLINRRKLKQDLTLKHDTFIRYSTPTSILLLDLDNLKEINDKLGHHTGDKAIIAVANTCRSQLRKIDIACRLGGDEFVIILPETKLKHAILFANRLHDFFNAELSQFSINEKPTTVSIGVTTIIPSDKSYEDMLKRADDALYKAKNQGKNQVVLA